MNKIILSLLLATVFAVSANAQNCVNSSRCDELGYKQTTNECQGFNPLICPFDKNKAHYQFLGKFFVSCEALQNEASIVNNKIMLQGNIDCKSLTLSEGVSLIGSPSVSFYNSQPLSSSVRISATVQNVLNNVSADHLSGSDKVNLSGCRFSYVGGFSELSLSGNNTIEHLQNITNLTLTENSILNLTKMTNIDLTKSSSLQGILVINENSTLALKGSANTPFNADIVNKSTQSTSPSVSDFSLNKNVYSATSFAIRNSVINGNVYRSCGSGVCTGIYDTTVYGKIYSKGGNGIVLSNNIFKSNSEIYIEGYLPTAADTFESGVTIGIKIPTTSPLNGLWETSKTCTFALSSTPWPSGCAQRIGDFEGVILPDAPI